ncbi:Hypothetical protein SMAX5B_000736 [Scophthalmus maximus]|uniref:Uncharacterized protein n=1 Tax=Scophthalmus maximus TaxID=52904 RepID=A0A2U9B671_SCOMX|nr:Hypothetical protein SMAX5B_000736 [Scophthalmus maximus]
MPPVPSDIASSWVVDDIQPASRSDPEVLKNRPTKPLRGRRHRFTRIPQLNMNVPSLPGQVERQSKLESRYRLNLGSDTGEAASRTRLNPF